jgi:hypothetical protein
LKKTFEKLEKKILQTSKNLEKCSFEKTRKTSKHFDKTNLKNLKKDRKNFGKTKLFLLLKKIFKNLKNT